MNIYKTAIPGMVELSGVGHSSQDSYDKTMTPASLKGCSVVVSSLTVDQKDEAKRLLKNGFLQVGPPKRNPNSGNMILLFIKFIHNG